jgi:D-alanyl-D-alanine carboxypeptidase
MSNVDRTSIENVMTALVGFGRWLDTHQVNRRIALVVALGVLLAGCSETPPDPRDQKSVPGAVATAATDVATADAAADAVEERLEEYRGTYPGALVLLRVGDEIRFVTAGYADRRTRKRMTERHRFPVGSVTKTMVATVVLQLVEDGELRLSDSVEHWLPGLVPRGDRITVAQLLSHHSGLYNFTDSPRFRWTSGWEPVEILRLATTEEPAFAPGARASYSNTNYIVLGLLVERITGKRLADVMREQVFAPAGMSDTSLATDRVTEPPRVHGYEGRQDVTLDDLSAAWAAGGVVSSARDLDAFLHALTGGRLLASATFDDMARPRGRLSNREGLDYALGLSRTEPCSTTMLGHGGALLGFLTEAWTTKEGDRSAVAMVNDTGSGAALDALLFTALCG